MIVPIISASGVKVPTVWWDGKPLKHMGSTKARREHFLPALPRRQGSIIALSPHFVRYRDTVSYFIGTCCIQSINYSTLWINLSSSRRYLF